MNSPSRFLPINANLSPVFLQPRSTQPGRPQAYILENSSLLRKALSGFAWEGLEFSWNLLFLENFHGFFLWLESDWLETKVRISYSIRANFTTFFSLTSWLRGDGVLPNSRPGDSFPTQTFHHTFTHNNYLGWMCTCAERAHCQRSNTRQTVFLTR